MAKTRRIEKKLRKIPLLVYDFFFVLLVVVRLPNASAFVLACRCFQNFLSRFDDEIIFFCFDVLAQVNLMLPPAIVLNSSCQISSPPLPPLLALQWLFIVIIPPGEGGASLIDVEKVFPSFSCVSCYLLRSSCVLSKRLKSLPGHCRNHVIDEQIKQFEAEGCPDPAFARLRIVHDWANCLNEKCCEILIGWTQKSDLTSTSASAYVSLSFTSTRDSHQVSREL